MTKNTVRHVLLELERAGWDSLCNQTGSEYYGERMLPNALMVLANGIAMDRDMVVSALSESSAGPRTASRRARADGTLVLFA